MVAEGGGVAAHPRQELQLGTGVADRGAERGPHAVVAGVEDQHGTAILARRLALRDQGGQPREPAAGAIVVQGERRVVQFRSQPDQVRVEVVGVQDREGRLPGFPAAAVDGPPGRISVAPAAAEPATNSRRSSVSSDIGMMLLFTVPAAAGFSWRTFIAAHSRYLAGRCASAAS
jgi:hypothetical protein